MSDVVLTDSNFASAFLLPTQYVFVVMAVLVLEAGVGALARLYEEQVGPELRMNLNRTFLENYSVRSRETAAIDQMQKEVSTRAIQRNFLSISQTAICIRAVCEQQPLSNNCERNKTRARVPDSAQMALFRYQFPHYHFYIPDLLYSSSE